MGPAAALTPVLTGSAVHSRCGPAGPGPARGSHTVTAAIFRRALRQRRGHGRLGPVLYGSVVGGDPLLFLLNKTLPFPSTPAPLRAPSRALTPL